ncbi:unnamed protein product, partial [Chrysoparadoxa australica]
DPVKKTWQLFQTFFSQEAKRGIDVNKWIDNYNELHDDNKANVEERNSKYSSLVNAYYELATLFYEWGWGTSFHFAERLKSETFRQSILRHEYYLAGRLGVKKGSKLLDCGCGVGGPYRNIATFTGCDVTGWITISEYQVVRANKLNEAAGMADQVRSVHGDFMALPFESNTFDGVYAIEATCHAPDRRKVYSEIYRVLKPGSIFACYEWVLTDRYDGTNAEHRRIKKKIEEGDGLPDMCKPVEVNKALKESGFEIVETRDMALDENPGGKPWYHPLTPAYNVFSQRFQFTSIGMFITRRALWVLELLRLAPEGTNKVQGMLQEAAIGCAQGGTTGTFTPMYLAVVRKPLKANK